MKKLKTGYIRVYLDLYRKARLGVAQDMEKKDLLQDYRLKRLRRLATVNSINSVQLSYTLPVKAQLTVVAGGTLPLAYQS